MAKKLKNKRKRYSSRYQLGGLRMSPNQQIRAQMFQGGGMYADNTIQSAGQGQQGQTANIVYAQSDPRVLEARRQQELNVQTEAARRGQETVAEATQIQQQGQMLGDQAALQAEQDVRGTMGGIEAGLAGVTGVKGAQTAAISGARDAYRLARAANLAKKAQSGVEAGVQTLKQAQQGARALELASKAGLTGTTADVATLAQGAGGSALGAGLKSFASSGAGIGTIASLAGMGISKLSDDKDPTTYKAGEVAGDVLSSAGTGASIGAMVGGPAAPITGLIGGLVGGVYGGLKGLFSRNKARREKRRAEREAQRKKTKLINKYNKDISEQYGLAKSATRAAELKSKEYSGYDIGRNLSYRGGGLRLGMPRYGYSA